MTQKPRCPWCGDDPLYVAYHDEEWGVPCHDEHKLFEHLLLEGAQAGLAWITILRKRENYRKAFHDFDAKRIARYGEADVARLLGDAGIVRNRLKVAAFIQNAGYIGQTLNLPAGTYTLNFQGVQRGGSDNYGTQVIQAAVDGTAIGSFQPPAGA